MERVLDVRGLSCPLPLVCARGEIGSLAAGDVLVVLATDPEAPVDLAALATDEGMAFAADRDGEAWRISLRR